MARTLRSIAMRIARARAELEVPPSSIEVLGMLIYAASSEDDVVTHEGEQWARAVAAPMIAVELRNWVRSIETVAERSYEHDAEVLHGVAQLLAKRADELGNIQ